MNFDHLVNNVITEEEDRRNIEDVKKANQMVLPLLIVAGVAGLVLLSRPAGRAWRRFIDVKPRTASELSALYPGGFEATMTQYEASLILGVRMSAKTEQIRQAHKRLMIINHPDAGGSSYLALKINEAKQVLLEKE